MPMTRSIMHCNIAKSLRVTFDTMVNMDADPMVYNELSGELLKHLAEAYAYLLELAERDPCNIPCCQGILAALAQFDIQAGSTRRATSPYVELNEYFLYLLDIQKPAQSKADRALQKKALADFKAMVMDFIKQYAPSVEASRLRQDQIESS